MAKEKENAALAAEEATGTPAMTAEEMMEVMAGQTESTEEESVETIDNGSALTGETQPLETVAQ